MQEGSWNFRKPVGSISRAGTPKNLSVQGQDSQTGFTGLALPTFGIRARSFVVIRPVGLGGEIKCLLLFYQHALPRIRSCVNIDIIRSSYPYYLAAEVADSKVATGTPSHGNVFSLIHLKGQDKQMTGHIGLKFHMCAVSCWVLAGAGVRGSHHCLRRQIVLYKPRMFHNSLPAATRRSTVYIIPKVDSLAVVVVVVVVRRQSPSCS